MNRANDNLLIHVARRAMACEFEVRFPADPYEQGTEAALESLDLLEPLEEQLSYFRPASEISRINLFAAEEPVEVSPPLFDLLVSAMKLFAETDGAYDITAAPLWEVWGFARRAGAIPSDADLAKARSCVGGHLVELDPTQSTVRFRKPGVRLNLGSIGKGYALDFCAERLLALKLNDFLLHGGQSSVLARGFQSPKVSGSGQPPSPWEIGVRHPRQPNLRMAIVRLYDRALGTSGGQFQSFRHRGRRFGHILDPRSGQPAEGMLSTTVVAATAALADALSTAFYVMGPEQSLNYCQNHPEIGAVLIFLPPHGGGVAIRTAGLGEQELTICKT
jgi:FAD:protein FMN transferase